MYMISGAQSWPKTDSITKPWTRWWWLGSAVDEKGLTYNLDKLRAAGIGGVEITPIYGIKGQEKAFVPFLNPRWLNLLSYTLKEAASRKMGVDLANATGWPFGGPWVGPEDASKTIYRKKFKLTGGQSLDSLIVYVHPGFIRTANTTRRKPGEIPAEFRSSPMLQEWALDQIQFAGNLPIETVMAYGTDNQSLNLTNLVDQEGRLRWTAPAGKWEVWALFRGLHGKMVERAAPGGEGYAIDHFSKGATDRYLEHFTKAFQGRDLSKLRGFFNDSYEVDDASGQANWTTSMFEQFQQIKGYDLRNYLPYLFGEGDQLLQSRVLYDYRTVIDSMILHQFTETWKSWGDSRGKILRNQSHGSPANTLDLYSVVDIPETEGTDWLRFKFATSAAHVAGKELVSAEAATWLDEHFLSTWGDVKKALDLYFLAGVNHIVYHGTPYSSPEAAWPGWNFYAAVQFQPTNPQWKHFHQLNEYVTRVQSFLQHSKPAHQILLYYPLHNRYAQRGGPLLQHFDGMERNFEHTDFEDISKRLQQQGIGFDFVSDRQLLQVKCDAKTLQTGGNSYKMILVPEIEVMDLPTWQRLFELAEAGAHVVFHKRMPQTLPGLFQLEARIKQVKNLQTGLHWRKTTWGSEAERGKGSMAVVDDWDAYRQNAVLHSGKYEAIGLHAYLFDKAGKKGAFVVNRTDVAIDSLVTYEHQSDVVFFDPMTGAITKPAFQVGQADSRKYRIRLEPQQSMIISQESAAGAPDHFYYSSPKAIIPLQGRWTLKFDEGGPKQPAEVVYEDGPDYWTNSTDSARLSFSGLATYSTTFKVSKPAESLWQLDLGALSATAAVVLNGKSIGVSVGPKHLLIVPAGLLQTQNTLQVSVASLMANRIADMDRKEIPWKIFYNINMSARKKENVLNGIFDARHWKPIASGLAGPVKLLRFGKNN
jgi:hypothetical protein